MVVLIVVPYNIITKKIIANQTSYQKKVMKDKIIFGKDSASVKNPKYLKENVFFFSPRIVKVEPTTCRKIDSEVVAFLPQKSKGFLTSVCREGKINKLFSGKCRLWVEILNLLKTLLK